MFQRKPRRFRHRSNGRGHLSHGNDHRQARLRSNSFSNSQARNNFRSTQSAEKLLEKYNTLAKEAKSSGDETSYENYLQHADHFARIIDDKNRNQAQRKPNPIHKTEEDNKYASQRNDINQNHTNDNKK